ncbi:MAG: cupin domain-containing protein [Candidatus Saganbacteria bacterium]|nr:cupin domain-containing protein [Candidatus Saganbacteria bacterium]
MTRYDLKNLTAFSKKEVFKNVFLEHNHLKAQVTCLSAGQQIPPCKMEHDVLFFVMSGNGAIIVDSKRKTLKAGQAAFVPKEAKWRSIKAKTKMIILAVQGR